METIKQIVYSNRDASKWCGGNIGVRPATDTDWEMLLDWLCNFADGIEEAQRNDPFVRHKAAIVDALAALLAGCNPCGETVAEVGEFLNEVKQWKRLRKSCARCGSPTYR